MHSSLHSAAVAGAGALPVEVQVDLALGLPGFHLVGLPDLACNDARVRVLTAIRNSGYQLPQKKITVNLAPGDLPKHGSAFDLAIALGVLAAAGAVPPPQAAALAVGELTLSGNVLPVRGVLPIALEARKLGFSILIVPEENAAEGALVQGVRVYGARSLTEAAEMYCGTSNRPPAAPGAPAETSSTPDLSDVRGQGYAKAALEVAAAGGHNALLMGPRGRERPCSRGGFQASCPRSPSTRRSRRPPSGPWPGGCAQARASSPRVPSARRTTPSRSPG